MEDDLNIWTNGRRPQYLDKWKTTSIFWKMEDDLNYLEMEDNLNINKKITQISFEMKYGPKFVISKPSISFLLQLVYLATAGPELGTAQPQLVIFYCLFKLQYFTASSDPNFNIYVFSVAAKLRMQTDIKTLSACGKTLALGHTLEQLPAREENRYAGHLHQDVQ